MKFFFQIEFRNIHETALIGLPPEMRDYKRGRKHFGVEVDEEARIGAYCTIDGGWLNATHIGNCLLLKHVHVGHDAWISDGVEIAPHTSVGGFVYLGENVKVGQSAVFKPYVKVGDGAVVGMGAVVTKDVAPGAVVYGNPARPATEHHNLQGRTTIGLNMQHVDEPEATDDNMWSDLYNRKPKSTKCNCGKWSKDPGVHSFQCTYNP